MPVTRDPSPSAPQWWWVLAVSFGAYLVLARLGLLLAIAPGLASPLWPAAGLGLVAVLVWGRWALLGTALGSMAANLWFTAGTDSLTATDLALTAAIGIGAALQAGLGAALVKRFVGQPLLLAEPAQLWRFIALGALLASVVNCSIGLAALASVGRIDPSQALPHWAAWWVGDALGVLAFAPVMLSLIGQPREEWAPRRWSVALPLLVVTLLLGLAIREVMSLDAQRQRQAFEREAESAARAVQERLMQPVHALEAMRGLISETPLPEREAFRRASAPWLAAGDGLQALGWNERVARADMAAFEASEQASGMAEFRIFARRDAGVAEVVATDDAHVIRFIEPLPDNVQALGVDTQSIATARLAIEQAVRGGSPVASDSFALTQGGLGVVIYQAVYHGTPTTVDERAHALRGVVFATLRLDSLLRAAATTLPPTLRLCLLDTQEPAPARVLAGPPGCDKLAPLAPLQVTPLSLAGRRWQLRVDAPVPVAPGAGSTWPFALAGLLASGLLGALLLIVTGRARRIEAAVQDRTIELQQRSDDLQQEIAERLRTDAALRESQQILRNILDNIPIGVAYTDTAGRILEANPKLCDMLGPQGGRLAATQVADLLHPEDRAAETAIRQRLLAGEAPPRWRVRCLAADGRVLWAQVDLSVLRDAQGAAHRLVWVIEDITDHLALEEAQQARRGADAANLAKSEFLSRMSHELRTPLNAMLGFAQLLELDRKQPLTPRQLEWTGQIRQAGWHLLRMINDTLDLSRIESGHFELESKALDLAELVAGAQAMVKHQADLRGVSIEVRLDDQARSVVGDATRITQILANLLSNAVKYNIEAGEVLVSSHPVGGGMVALEVSDTGLGMDAAQLAQLFQPFNRLGREAGPVEGTGIGLVISRRLAELMGGSLRADSTPDRGSTLTLELPRAMTAPVPSSFDEKLELPEASYHQRRVHYIEDNETNVEVMRGIFALRPQVKLEVSTLGLDGLSAIRRRRPSLILLDMHLPDIDGLELLRYLQADPETSDIPVIVVSADATEDRITAAIAAGASHYLAKPVNVAQFLTVLDAALEQADTQFG
jgi:PAS domain S-box-containing protein